MYQDDDFLFWSRDECNMRVEANPKDLKAIFRLGIIDLSEQLLESSVKRFLYVVDQDPSFMQVHVCMKLGEVFYKLD